MSAHEKPTSMHIIEDAYQEFRKDFVHADSSPAETLAMRIVFFAGAMSHHRLMATTPKEKVAETYQLVEDEFQKWGKEIVLHMPRVDGNA